MNTWITADWHLGEDRFDIMARPFKSVDEMINTFIANHNTLVDKNDTVYVVGDVVYQKKPEFLDRVAAFNGKKILVRGNHDRVIDDKAFLKYFSVVVPEGKGIDLDVDGHKLYLTHYPTLGKSERFNLVGHIHGAWKYQLNSFNVGVDVNHFRPVNLNTIPFHIKAVSEFYDDDVWVAYNAINFVHRNHRGKKGSYFPS
jgi:calcineurin-like phosphoesterase family protein